MALTALRDRMTNSFSRHRRTPGTPTGEMLLAFDRLSDDKLAMTQELIADVLATATWPVAPSSADVQRPGRSRTRSTITCDVAQFGQTMLEQWQCRSALLCVK